QIHQELAPKINHPAPGIFHIACGGLLEDPFVNVVRDLVAQILLHFSFNSLFVERVDFTGIHPVSTEKLPVTLIKLPKRSIRPLSIDVKERSEFQPIGKWIIPGRPNRPVFGARRNAQIIKRKVMLFVQADGRLGSILFSVKQPEKLPIIFPVPAGVTHVLEPFLLDLASNVTERWESIRRRRSLRAKLFFLREPERTNPSENFQPRQKQPTRCRGQTPQPAGRNEINREKSGRKDAERARFLCIRILKTAQADAEHDHPECKKDAEKHYGLISCSLRNFSSWSVAKLPSTFSLATKAGT